jgi:hypothetical protein
MLTSDMSKYPKIAEYVRRRMPQVINVPIIVRNMKKFGSLSKTELKTALKWRDGPTLVIKPLSNFQCGVKAAYGCFRPSKPNQIELAESDAKIFETDAYGAGIDKNSKGKGLFIVGATILHELCHWGNHKHSVNEKTEQGLAFERATYGKTIG